jgi:muconolactone delta-isomerase
MKCMVSAKFRPEDRAEIAPRVPQEQARIRELREQGIVEALYIDADRSHVWLVMAGESQDEVQRGLQSLPLHPYMVEVEVAPLAQV